MPPEIHAKDGLTMPSASKHHKYMPYLMRVAKEIIFARVEAFRDAKGVDKGSNKVEKSNFLNVAAREGELRHWILLLNGRY